MPTTLTRSKATVKKSTGVQKKQKSVSPAREVKKDIADSYNRVKEFEGRQYSGMQIGRSHKWYYDKGE